MSIFVLMPIAYYPTFLRYHLPGTTDFNFFHFWWRTLTVGPWPSGPAWFLWVLLAFDVVAAAICGRWRRAHAEDVRPADLFAARPAVDGLCGVPVISVVVYLPMRLMFGEASWLEPGGYPLPIQTSRILLYAGYFFTGVGIGVVSLRAGILARGRRSGETLADLARLCVVFYGCDPAAGLCPPQLDRGLRFAAAVRGRPRMAWPSRCSAPR